MERQQRFTRLVVRLWRHFRGIEDVLYDIPQFGHHTVALVNVVLWRSVTVSLGVAGKVLFDNGVLSRPAVTYVRADRFPVNKDLYERTCVYNTRLLANILIWHGVIMLVAS